MKHFLWKLLAFTLVVLVGCEKEDDYSTDFSGMWAQVAEYYYDGGGSCKPDKFLFFKEGVLNTNSLLNLYFIGISPSPYIEDGYLHCSIENLHTPKTFSLEPNKDKCYVFDDGNDVGFVQIKGDALYWYYNDNKQRYDVFERIKGFIEY